MFKYVEHIYFCFYVYIKDYLVTTVKYTTLRT